MHPDIIFGTTMMLLATCVIGAATWHGVKKGDFKWHNEGLVALAAIIIYFVICFPLLFGPHHPR